jgi:hypothetical protein
LERRNLASPWTPEDHRHPAQLCCSRTNPMHRDGAGCCRVCASTRHPTKTPAGTSGTRTEVLHLAGAGGKCGARSPRVTGSERMEPRRGDRRPFMAIISVAPAGAGLVESLGTPGCASLAWGYSLIAAPRLTFHCFTASEGAGRGKPNRARSLTLTALWAVVIVRFSCAWVRHRRMTDCSENNLSCRQL